MKIPARRVVRFGGARGSWDEFGMSKKRSFLKKDTRVSFPNFGRNLRKAFQAIGIKAKDIARDLGVSPVTVSRWFNGNRNISVELLYLFKERYRIDPNFVLTGRGSPVTGTYTDERSLFIEERKAKLRAQIDSLRRIIESLERELVFWEHESANFASEQRDSYEREVFDLQRIQADQSD